jgi:WD40 repeat protein
MKKSLFAILLLPILVWAAQSPFDGTWKIDLSSVQFPAKPTILVLQNGTYQDSTSKISVKADSTDQPLPEIKDIDTMAVKIIDDKTVQLTSKKNGKVVSTQMAVISADGNTCTYEFTEYHVDGKPPVTGKFTYTRLAAGPSGSHALSGTWQIQEAHASQWAITATYKSTADGLISSSPIGGSWEAQFDGKDYPMNGTPGYTVSLTKVNDRSIITTVKRDGKVFMVYHQTVSADGKTCTIVEENKVQGIKATFTATKQ